MKIWRALLYLKAGFIALIRSRPRDYWKILSRSPQTIKHLPDFDISMIVSIKDTAISKPILWLGEYEKGVTKVLLDYLKKDTHFLDVGANIGYFSLIVGKKCPQGKVWSFEPDPNNYTLLKSNIALNNLEHTVQPYQIALSDRQENIYFSSLGVKDNLGARFTAKESSTLLQHSLTGETPIQVKAVAVDSFLSQEKIDIIKVDVEGFELNVFQGMKHLLQDQFPVIIAEFAPSNLIQIGQLEPADFIRFFIDLQYQISIIEVNGNLILCNNATVYNEVMTYLSNKQQHHVDLLLQYH